MLSLNGKNIVLSRTDNIGDVIFTLPMAGLIKKFFPQSKIFFLGKKYTQDIVENCVYIDQFLNWDEIQASKQPGAFFQQNKIDVIIHAMPNKEIANLAKKASIPTRIGTSKRLFHWFTCNKLIALSRHNSSLHESQLNLKLLKPFGIPTTLPLEEMHLYYGFSTPEKLNNSYTDLIEKNKFNIIFHPKSKGSAREWDAKRYIELYHALPKEKFNIFATGTMDEKAEIQRCLVDHCPGIKNVVGVFSLSEFIRFIAQCDGLIACSTGPLHIAAALNKHTIGFYPPLKNMHPNRWGALGTYAKNMVGKPAIKHNMCKKKYCAQQSPCECLHAISSLDVLSEIKNWHFTR